MSEDKLVPTVRTALAVASPGPWKLRPRDVAFDQWPEEEWDRRALGWSDGHVLQFDIEGPAPVFGRGDFNGGDAVLVTHAVEWLTSLCERVEALEKERDHERQAKETVADTLTSNIKWQRGRARS